MVDEGFANSVEISQIDLRFEKTRLQDKLQEGQLSASMLESGIREPLQCIVTSDKLFILLDGFKRFRIAKKLGWGSVPCVELAKDEVSGILQLITISNNKSLNILEQAALVDELHFTFGLSTSEIAVRLKKSPAWVSVRLGILKEISDCVKDEIFAGRFPARAYMYILRPLTRVNKVAKSDIDDFVRSVAGKNISARNLEKLAYGYFHGGREFKAQLQKGNIDWTLAQLKNAEGFLGGPPSTTVNEFEQRVIRDLEITRKYRDRVVYGLPDTRLKTAAFFLQAHLLAEGILERQDVFVASLKEFLSKSHIPGGIHDHSGQEKGGLYPFSGRPV